MRSFIPRGFSRDIWALFTTNIISSIGFSVTMPYMSLYLHNVLHVPMTIVGVILMTTLLIGSTLGLYGGELSDRLGRKYIMVRSLSVRFFVFLLLGIAIMLFPHVLIIAGLMLLNSILFSFYGPASQAYIADLTNEEKRISAYGLLRMGGNLGWALGPALGGLIAAFDYSYLFFFTAFCMAVAVFVLTRYSRESLDRTHVVRHDETTVQSIFSVVRDTQYFVFALICLIIFTVWGQLVSPISVYSVNCVGISKIQVGFLFSINGFMVAALQYFITSMIRRNRELDALWIGSLIYAAGYLTVGFATNFFMLALSMVVITVAEMVITPATQSYASIIADPRHRGRYMGVLNLSQTMGWAIGPLLGGIMLDIFPGRNFYSWSIIAGIAVCACFGFIFFKNKYRSSCLQAPASSR
ncbi:MAG TPA: MFS transporter [bacterium]